MSSVNNIESFSLPFYVVHAFTKFPFKGNSAAVFLLPYHKVIADDVKQKIATEMMGSETAFVTKKKYDCFEDSYNFDLEWYTAKCKVSLCGHATLATAAVLFMALDNQHEILNFETASGILKAKHLTDNKIQIDLPAYNSSPVNEKYATLVKVLVGSLAVEDVVLSDSKYLLIRLSDRLTRKEFEDIQASENDLISAASDIIGVIVTLKSLGKEDCKDEEGNCYDFISRCFVPWQGLLEDPVTGSAHSVLAPYWSKILKKNSFYARQCSKRGGDLHIQLVQDRVHIIGNAVIIMKGQINV